MTYEDLPDIIRQKLFYSHQHDKNGFIVYPEKVVIECLGLMRNRCMYRGKPLKADRAFLYAESQMGLKYPVHKIEMSGRLYMLLTHPFASKIGCNNYWNITLGDIVKHPESEFLKLRNFGKGSLKELKELLSEFGLSLAPEETTSTKQ